MDIVHTGLAGNRPDEAGYHLVAKGSPPVKICSPGQPESNPAP